MTTGQAAELEVSAQENGKDTCNHHPMYNETVTSHFTLYFELQEDPWGGAGSVSASKTEKGGREGERG